MVLKNKIIFLLFAAVISYSFAGHKAGVLEFTSEGVAAVEARVVGKLFRSELVASGFFDVLDRNNMQSILKEQELQSSGCTDQSCAVRLGKLLNMEYMIYGSLMKLGQNFYINVGIVNVESSRIAASAKEKISDLDRAEKALQSIVEKIIDNIKKQTPAAALTESSSAQKQTGDKSAGAEAKKKTARTRTPEFKFKITTSLSTYAKVKYRYKIYNFYTPSEFLDEQTYKPDRTPITLGVSVSPMWRLAKHPALYTGFYLGMLAVINQEWDLYDEKQEDNFMYLHNSYPQYINIGIETGTYVEFQPGLMFAIYLNPYISLHTGGGFILRPNKLNVWYSHFNEETGTENKALDENFFMRHNSGYLLAGMDFIITPKFSLFFNCRYYLVKKERLINENLYYKAYIQDDQRFCLDAGVNFTIF
ncbi:MAG TPA: CsgG/HfaB family protein [Spirochaetota bacterium]|nr:CsgG/HfaB family protein [Spirochaetota bacterium]